MAVNTMVMEVPMLNAAPPLRVRVMVSRPPSRRIGAWSGIRATTMALETISATRTNAATPSRRPTRRAGLRLREPERSAALLALLALHAQVRSREREQARLPDRLAAGFAYSICSRIHPGE